MWDSGAGRTTFFRPDVATWQDPDHGGGFAYGQLSHSIALMLWLTGLRAARVGGSTWRENGIDLHDAATLVFEGGAVGSLAGAAAVPEEGRARLRIFLTGEAGMLEIGVDLDRCMLERHDGARADLALAPDSWRYDCVGPVDALVDLAQGKGENRSPGEIGAGTVEVIAAMLRSAASNGSPVSIGDKGG